MARNFANIWVAIWRDPEFRALTGSAQRTYMMLFSQHDIDAAGVLTASASRWGRYAVDTTAASITADIDALEGRRFVLVDPDTDEVLVRSFMRWDRGYRNPKRRPAIFEAIRYVQSDVLRDAIRAELARLDTSTPVGGVADDDATKPQLNTLFDIPSDTQPDSQADSLLRTRARGTRAAPEPKPEPKPKNIPPDSLRSSGPPTKRGTRLPTDFTITDDMREWAREKAPSCGLTDHEAFVDHWRAAPGAKGVKLDWPATWRNWMRRAEEGRWRGNGRRPPGPRPSTTDEAVAQTLRLAEGLDPNRQPPQRRAIAG